MLPLRLLIRRQPSSTCPDIRFCQSQRVRCFAGSSSHLAEDGGKGGRVESQEADTELDKAKSIDWTGEEKPSLMEQLFPEETRKYEIARRAAQDVPRLPLDRELVRSAASQKDTVSPTEPGPWTFAKRKETPREAEARKAVYREMHEEGTHASILFLQMASSNLIEEDFRRLAPRGKHVEGWTVEDDDILKIIPVRDLVDLKQTGSYYLLFKSQVAAFNYQTYVERVKRIASWQTPEHIDSPMQPPKGFLIEGLDAHDALQAFTLVPARQEFKLRRLRFPLKPLIWSLVKNGGYPAIVNRPMKMPFELRMTFEGPQIHIPAIQDIFAASSAGRAVNWGGVERRLPHISRWEPKKNVNHLNTNQHAQAQAKRIDENFAEQDVQPPKSENEEKRRTPQLVYILGFETERHSDSFRLYWHRRPMTYASNKKQHAADVEEDIPPIVNLEVLW